MKRSEASRWRVSNGVLRGGDIEPLCLDRIRSLITENTGLIPSQQTGGEDGGNKGREIQLKDEQRGRTVYMM